MNIFLFYACVYNSWTHKVTGTQHNLESGHGYCWSRGIKNKCVLELFKWLLLMLFSSKWTIKYHFFIIYELLINAIVSEDLEFWKRFVSSGDKLALYARASEVTVGYNVSRGGCSSPPFDNKTQQQRSFWVAGSHLISHFRHSLFNFSNI